MIKRMAIKYLRTRGQVTLPVIILISGIIIEIAIAGTFITYFLSAEGLGERLSARAETAALSGIYDAMIKITRDKEFGNVVCVNPYNLDVDRDSVEVKVCRVSDTNVYIYTVTAIGTASNRQKKFIAVIVVDQTTGKVQLRSIAEASIS